MKYSRIGKHVLYLFESVISICHFTKGTNIKLGGVDFIGVIKIVYSIHHVGGRSSLFVEGANNKWAASS